MSSLLLAAEGLLTEVECQYIEKEVDMGFFKNFVNNSGVMQSGCPCKCTCDCNRCGAWFS